jgi:hypothetical protein
MQNKYPNEICAMNDPKAFFDSRRRGFLAVVVVSPLMLLAKLLCAYGQDKSGFPDGYDAVQAAPISHKVIFENAFVRVLEVSVSPNTTVPASSPLAEFTGELGYRRQVGHMCAITARTAL